MDENGENLNFIYILKDQAQIMRKEDFEMQKKTMGDLQQPKSSDTTALKNKFCTVEVKIFSKFKESRVQNLI